MRKVLAAVLLVSILVSGCSGARSALHKSVDFVSPDNTFTATFPEEPKHRTETGEKNGTKYTMEIYESESMSRYLSISYGERTALYDTEKSIDDITKDMLDSFMKDKDIDILSKSNISSDAYEGIECVMSTQKDAGRLILRIYITGKRVYYVITETEKDKIDSKSIKKFLDSFAIIKEP